MLILGIILILIGLVVAVAWPDPRAHQLGILLLVLGVVLVILAVLLSSDLHLGGNDMAVGPLVWAVGQKLRRFTPALCGSWRN